jgi:ABC-type multidrug transport system ATPase subunit
MVAHDPIESALKVRELRKAFGPHVVLDGVSFDVAPGAIAVLCGANGAGKSTLLRCLAGLASFTGSAHVAGRVLDGSADARRRISYVPQTVGLPETGTVGELITLVARLRDADPRDLALPDGFLPPVERRLGVLSGGQRQRVVLAAAFLGGPPVLLLDEPAANLDDGGRDDLWHAVHTLTAMGTAVLVASPSPADLAGIADELIELHGGRIVGRTPMGLRPVSDPVRTETVARRRERSA